MVTEADRELPRIIARAQAGDPNAFSELYTRYAGHILRYLYARTREQEGAQDLTQEVFMRVLKGIGGFEYRGEKSFLGWLYTIAGNVLIGQIRRKHPVSTPLDEGLELVDPRGNDAVLSIFDRIALKQAINQLTQDQQQVLTLKFFADMTNGEIAQAIGRTEGAVKALQHRALQALSQILEREGQDPQEPLQARELNGKSKDWELDGVVGAQLDGAASLPAASGTRTKHASNGAERKKRAREPYTGS